MSTPEIVVADDAIEQLAERTAPGALVVMDENTREAAGARVARTLPGARQNLRGVLGRDTSRQRSDADLPQCAACRVASRLDPADPVPRLVI